MIKWNRQGFEAILCSAGASQACKAEADRIAANATARNSRGGAGFGTNVEIRFLYRSRRICWQVMSLDENAYHAEREDKVLTGSI